MGSEMCIRDRAVSAQESRTRSTKGRHRMVRRGDVMVLKTEEAPKIRSHGADGRSLLGFTRNEERAVMEYLARVMERKVMTHPDARPGSVSSSGDRELSAALSRISRFRL